MDAPEEEPELELQRATSDLIADLNASLRPLLWGATKSGVMKIRRRIDTFQELPQLLDPHLDRFIPLLADSFLAYLKSSTSTPTTAVPFLVPVSKAICQLLYRFCKVRGEKVIIRFFSTETKHIEVILSALEQRGPKEQRISSEIITGDEEREEKWAWEEIYISLLWLSQLILAPFDLESISSDVCDPSQYEIKDLVWPPSSPSLAQRIILLAIHYLSVPGKEKDAAKFLLVRISMRRDILENGTSTSLTKWAIAQFQPDSKSNTHHFLGVLSFFADLLASSIGTTNMESHLWPIFEVTQGITCSKDPLFRAIYGSAVSRKLILKIFRSISVIALHKHDDVSNFELIEGSISYMLEAVADSSTPVRLAASKALSIITLKLPAEMAEEVVDDILSAFEKNVFWVTRGEDQEKINSSKSPGSSSEPNMKYLAPGVKKIQRKDISRVNLLEWHGCIMTLSQLIYRRAIPSQNLSPILAALRLGLSFEQRSTSGSSIGTNVRDAACFGIWALARKYRTVELQEVVVKQDSENSYSTGVSRSTLQILASDLVVSATLDPAGNIRRGSAAALQELVGRHPNTIEKGIELVQLIDYHAIARRDRAMRVVALKTSALADSYYAAILENMLGWRGAKNFEKAARQSAAATIGQLVWARKDRTIEFLPFTEISRVTDQLVSEILLLKARESDERHGLILSFTAIINQFQSEFDIKKLMNEFTGISFSPREPSSSLFPDLYEKESLFLEALPEESSFLSLTRTLLRDVTSIIKEIHTSYKKYRALQNTAEAVCELMNAAFPLVIAHCIIQEFKQKKAESMRLVSITTQETDSHQKNSNLRLELLTTLDPLFCLSKSPSRLASEQYLAIVTAYRMKIPPPDALMEPMKDLLDQFLKDAVEESVDTISTAAGNYGFLCGPKHEWFLEWQKNAFLNNLSGVRDRGRAYIHTIFKIPTELYDRYSQSCNNGGESFTFAVHSRWHSIDDIQVRIIIMNCLATCSAIRECPIDYIDLIQAGMNDHTTTSQGDVGSLLRIASIKAAVAVWKNDDSFGIPHDEEKMQKILEVLMPQLLRLASEKLDRVRNEAKIALLTIPASTSAPDFQALSQLVQLSTSSKAYYYCLLDVHYAFYPPSKYLDLFGNFIATLATSADSGSEDVIHASRAALVEFCQLKEGHLPPNSAIYSPAPGDIQSSILRAFLDIISSDVERFVIPGLEVLAFLISVGTLHQPVLNNSIPIFDVVDKALHNCKNFRKLQAGIKLFGALLEPEELNAISTLKPKAIRSLTQILVHRYPKIRSSAADELFFRTGLGKGVNWTNEKKIEEMRTIRESLLMKNKSQQSLSE
ncbi:hypothetical protein K3495_g4733 [Podosphaera aphanis]|nr:hypothetical protein K3495_g4733 [Podosphaera aphanis]